MSVAWPPRTSDLGQVGQDHRRPRWRRRRGIRGGCSGFALLASCGGDAEAVDGFLAAFSWLCSVVEVADGGASRIGGFINSLTGFGSCFFLAVVVLIVILLGGSRDSGLDAVGGCISTVSGCRRRRFPWRRGRQWWRRLDLFWLRWW